MKKNKILDKKAKMSSLCTKKKDFITAILHVGGGRSVCFLLGAWNVFDF